MINTFRPSNRRSFFMPKQDLGSSSLGKEIR
ncbi:hypothetical protein M8044_000522, partial [Columbia Basin potato purple top phytoplasma]|nr:hypothetical protein [Columbia Basin potato purple top phytoplasma]